jgi:hypothetical protein
MAYIGNTVQNQGFTPAIDYFNGNGVTVTFTLSRPVVSVAQMIVAIDNVIQNPSSAFTVSGNSITFTSAPLSGTNNIWVEYTSLITQYNAISQDPSVIGDITATGGYLATGDFGNTFTDGTIIDYVTGMSRITTGSAAGMTFYNGGPSARNALMTLASTGNVGIGTTSPAYKLDVNGIIRGTSNIYSADGSAFVFGTGSTAFVSGSSTSNVVLFNTASTERMRINSAGVVTMPFQPSFVAGRSGNYTMSDATVAVWNTTSRNVGTHYNTSNGLFTAPVSGMYSFTVSIFADVTISQVWWILNGARGVSVSVAGQSILVGSAVIYLNANDTFGFAPFTNVPTFTFIANSLHSYFAGTLIG